MLLILLRKSVFSRIYGILKFTPVQLPSFLEKNPKFRRFLGGKLIKTPVYRHKSPNSGL